MHCYENDALERNDEDLSSGVCECETIVPGSFTGYEGVPLRASP